MLIYTGSSVYCVNNISKCVLREPAPTKGNVDNNTSKVNAVTAQRCKALMYSI